MENRRILESWKEISAHLRRNVRTCQRWESEMGLPVHRLDGTPKARVYAYTDELDRWFEEKLGHGEAKFNNREFGRKEDLKGFTKPKKLFVPAAGLLVLVVIAILLWHPSPHKPGVSSGKASLAVLPFENYSGDSSLEN
ncbi:MAG: hypothetical protein ABSG73_11905 [Candidatus Aminicenantales bacterium]|jgi:hypothetical protein